MDRYLAAIYPDTVTGVDYLPQDAVVFFSESGRVEERAKAAAVQLRQDLEFLLEAGVMTGEFARVALSPEELYAALEAFPVIMADSLPTSRHPVRPRGLLSINARQLSALRRKPGDRCGGSGTVPAKRQRGTGALRQREPVPEPSADAGGAGDSLRPGSQEYRHAPAGADPHWGGWRSPPDASGRS